jgi:hypothetical protein
MGLRWTCCEGGGRCRPRGLGGRERHLCVVSWRCGSICVVLSGKSKLPEAMGGTLGARTYLRRGSGFAWWNQ